MIGLLDLHRAIEKDWDGSAIQELLHTYWAAGQASSYLGLCEVEAQPGSPKPYVVYTIPTGESRTRMSDFGVKDKREIRQNTIVFDVYAAQTAAKSAKEVAGEVHEAVLRHYGGHPDEGPLHQLSMQSACIVNLMLTNEFGVQVDTEVYRVSIEYVIQYDTRVRV